MSKTPPGPGIGSAYANVRSYLGNRAEFLERLSREYGDVCRFQLGFFDIYFVNDPELVKQVFMHEKDFVKTPAMRFLKPVLGNGLLLSEGEFHRRQRRLMQPAFHPKRVRMYSDLMVRLAVEACERWRDEHEVDIHAEMMRLTMEIAGESLFGASVESETRRVKEALDEILPSIDRIAQPTGLIRMLLPLPSNFRVHRSRKVLNDVIYELIEKGRNSPADRDDLLSTLLAAQDEEGDGTRMTDRQVRDEVMTLFLAGHETTAVALSWTWYLLAQNPDALTALHEELDAILGGREPTAEDIPKLAYTRMVLAETLRLYPPAYLMDRMTTAEWAAGDYIVPPKKYVFLSPYTMHRNPKYFSDPEQFRPARWTPDNIAERPKFSYFPFGGGPRTCIGEQFAWTEMILVVATIAQRWRLGLAPNQLIEIEPLVTLRPKDGVRMIPQRR